MESTPDNTRAAAVPESAGTFELLWTLASHKRLLIIVPLAAALLATGIALLIPKTYLGVARVVPAQQSSSLAATLLSQIGGGGALAGIAGSSLGMRNMADLYVGILQGRTVADALIERFKLKELYEEDTLLETRDALADNTTISAGRDGIIEIAVLDEDPKRAAELANAYVDALQRLTQEFTITEASARRAFFERRMKEARTELASAEQQMRDSQEKTGVLKLEEQGRAIIEAIAAMRAQITVKEVQIASMGSFATPGNPDLQRAQAELSQLRAQAAKLEQAEGTKRPDIFIPSSKVPEVGLEYVRRLREVKYQEFLFESLAKQFELARIEEAKDAVVIQVVDKAVPADKKHKPKRALIVLVATFVAFLLTILGLAAKVSLQRLNADPFAAEQLLRIKRALRN